MRKNLTLDERELAEIGHCLSYMQRWHHGTVGHNLLMLVGKLSDALGFELTPTNDLLFHKDPTPRDLFVPEEGVRIYE